MGREVKRVDFKFDWFERTTKDKKHSDTWFGYIMESVPCKLCDSTGKNLKGETCPLCYGERTVCPYVEVPEGDGWQMWETCSEGSPISPVFTTPKKLAKWLADNNASSFGSMTATEEEWLAMIKEGWCPSAVSNGNILMSGVEAASKLKGEKDGN